MLIQPVRCALLALILTVPLASLGVLLPLLIAPGIIGQSAVIICQLWLIVFLIIWAECYRKYRSIWSSYMSHAIAVVSICIVAWQVLFGG